MSAPSFKDYVMSRYPKDFGHPVDAQLILFARYLDDFEKERGAAIDPEEVPFSGWALVEVFGHRQLAGVVSEARIAGKRFVQIDSPESPARREGDYVYEARPAATQFYSPGAIYSLTPSTEEDVLSTLRMGQCRMYAPEEKAEQPDADPSASSDGAVPF